MKPSVFAFSVTVALTSSASAVTMSMLNVSGGAISGGTYVVGVEGTTGGINNWPGPENPGNVRDGTTNKYLNFAKLNTGVIVSPTGGSETLNLNNLTFTAANDAAERDPLTFSLYGSTTALGGGDIAIASLTLIVADAPTGLLTDPGRNTAGPAQSFTNNTAYASYLLVFPTVRNEASANSMQIAEVGFASVVPEPGTAGLAGLALLGFARRKR